MQVFVAKVVQEKEKKLKEFNFKLLHGIMLCNKNLFRWKIRPYDICDVCQEIQTIEHLLYNCPYVKPLWNVVDLVFETKVNFMFVFNPRWDMHSLRAKEIKDSPNSQAVPKILVLLKNGTVWFHIGSG